MEMRASFLYRLLPVLVGLLRYFLVYGSKIISSFHRLQRSYSTCAYAPGSSHCESLGKICRNVDSGFRFKQSFAYLFHRLSLYLINQTNCHDNLIGTFWHQ